MSKQATLEHSNFAESSLPGQLVSQARELGQNLYVLSRDKNAYRYPELADDIEGLLTQRISSTIFRFNLNSYLVEIDTRIGNFPDIQPPYGLKGGAARIALRHALGLEHRSTPRDIDLVRFGNASEQDDEAMSQKFMPEDYFFNKKHGVEIIKSLPRYLSSRDFTINELAFIDGKIICSPQCIFDTLGGIIRTSAANSHHIKRQNLRAAHGAKSLRFLAEATAMGRDAEIIHFNSDTLNTFSLSLNLKRALEQGELTGNMFVAAAELTQVMPTKFIGLDAGTLKERLGPLLKQGPQFFEPFEPPRT